LAAPEANRRGEQLVSEVGALIVKLQAETAQFREDLGKVKSDLDSVGDSGGRAGAGVSGGMYEARASLMLVEDSVGVRLPRALNTLIARMPGIGQAFSMMLPIAGVAVAVEVIGKLIEKHRELAENVDKMKSAQENLEGTIGSVYGGLHDKLLQAGIAADELAGRHLSAVKKELELIDNQSLSEIAQSFDELAGAAEKSLSLIKAGMFEVGSGGEAARASLSKFQSQYEMLLKTGKGDEANKLLDDKITREEAILALQTAAASKEGTGVEQMQRRTDAVKGLVELAGQVVDFDDKSIESERELLEVLHAEANARETILQTANVKKGTVANKEGQRELSAEVELVKALQAQTEKYNESLSQVAQTKAETAIASAKGGSAGDPAAQLSQQKQAIEEQRALSLSAINDTKAAKLAAYLVEQQAAGADADKQRSALIGYLGALKEAAGESAKIQASMDKKGEQADAAAMAEKIKLAIEANKSMVAIAVSATKEEETAKLDGAKSAAAANNAMHSLGLESERQYIQNKIALSEMEFAEKRKSLNAQIELENAAADMANESGDSKGESEALEKANQLRSQRNTLDADFKAQLILQEAEAEKLASSWKNYFTNMKNETQDLSTTIRENLQKSMTQFEDQFANSMAKCIVEGKNLGMAMRKEAEQMAESMISSLVKWLEQWIITHVMANVIGKSTGETQIAAASGLAGANMVASWAAAPFPIDALAPAMGAQAAAAALAFSAETGGGVPGTGPVPLLAHGGETIVTKALTDRVEASERNGSNGGDMHMHYSPIVHAMDASGVDRVLTKHGSDFERAARNVARRRNK
jgi:hypothetical protein